MQRFLPSRAIEAVLAVVTTWAGLSYLVAFVRW
jgi:hypothetical protein